MRECQAFIQLSVVIDGISRLASLRFVGAAFLLNLYTAQARGVTKPNLVLGTVLGLGGLGQTLAGILEWASGNTYGVSLIILPGMRCSGEESQELRMFCFLERQAVLFNSYGAFWLSFSSTSRLSRSTLKPTKATSSFLYPPIWCSRGLR